MFDLDKELSKNSLENLTDVELAVHKQVEAEASPHLKGNPQEFSRFILPFIKEGLLSKQILNLLHKIPQGWSLDHLEMYYDFRLARWIRHIEPKDLTDTVKEYLENAGDLQEGVLYVQKILADLSKKMGSGKS